MNSSLGQKAEEQRDSQPRGLEGTEYSSLRALVPGSALAGSKESV